LGPLSGGSTSLDDEVVAFEILAKYGWAQILLADEGTFYTPKRKEVRSERDYSTFCNSHS